MRILIIGPKRYQESMSFLAYQSGWNLTSIANSAEVPANAFGVEFSAILVVIERGQSTGLHTIRALAQAGISSPIVAMQVIDKSERRAESLLQGAVISLPCAIDTAELQLQLLALVRRDQGRSTNEITISGITLDPFARHIHWQGTPISLAGRQFELLELLFANKGRVLSRDFIMDYLYGGEEEPVAKVIDVQICKIRNTLRNFVGDQEMIRTIWGTGYVVDDRDFHGSIGIFTSKRVA